MSKKDKLLARMRRNPRDWRIDDLLAIAKRLGLQHRAEGGSHYVFSHPSVTWIVSVPVHGAIKPVYIHQFLALIDAIED